MIAHAHSMFLGIGIALAAAAMTYGLVACVALCVRIRGSRFIQTAQPPVTILKPLCGAEPETYACLRSFCEQAYPQFEIVFGVCDPNDPVLSLVSRLQHEFPHLDLAVAVDRSQHGSSRKVSNLINMLPLARHDYLVVSDSDVQVNRDYLANIIGPLLDPGVGIVTCAYRGCPRRGLWPLLGAMFINEWFLPSVRVAAMAGSRAFAFGATLALRRAVLERVGGFTAIASQLADDYRLGELTRRLGLRTVLCEVVVDTCVAEASFRELARHELRWLRTIRSLRPSAYCFCFVTFGLPVAALGALLAGGAAPVVGMFWITALTRVVLHGALRGTGSGIWQIAVVPIRDTLSLGLWLWSFSTRRVQWREECYQVTRDGSVQLM